MRQFKKEHLATDFLLLSSHAELDTPTHACLCYTFLMLILEEWTTSTSRTVTLMILRSGRSRNAGQRSKQRRVGHSHHTLWIRSPANSFKQVAAHLTAPHPRTLFIAAAAKKPSISNAKPDLKAESAAMRERYGLETIVIDDDDDDAAYRSKGGKGSRNVSHTPQPHRRRLVEAYLFFSCASHCAAQPTCSWAGFLHCRRQRKTRPSIPFHSPERSH